MYGWENMISKLELHKLTSNKLVKIHNCSRSTRKQFKTSLCLYRYVLCMNLLDVIYHCPCHFKRNVDDTARERECVSCYEKLQRQFLKWPVSSNFFYVFLFLCNRSYKSSWFLLICIISISKLHCFRIWLRISHWDLNQYWANITTIVSLSDTHSFLERFFLTWL